MDKLMLGEGSAGPKKGINPYILACAISFVCFLLYAGWVFFSRREQDLAFEQQKATAASAAEKASAQRTFEGMGGNRFEILSFYASPSTIRPGDEADLCYSVSNAKSVSLTPPAGSVWPSYSRCLEVSPKKTTTYTLTALDDAGNSKKATVKVEVH
jgi:hypothetical protein